MRLGRTTSLGTLLATTLGLLALGACGDDAPPSTGDGTSTGTADSTGAPPTTMTLTTTEGVDDTTTRGSSSGEPTTAVDTTEGATTDPDTGTSESGDSTTGEPPAGCADGGGLSFSTLTSVDNDMITNLDVAGLVSCNMDITITVTGGTICAVDDGAGGYFYTVETLALEDVPPVNCGLATVGLTNMSVVNTGDGLEVVVDQNGGTMVGNQSIDVVGDVEGMALGMPVGPAPLEMFSGVLPEGEVEFGNDDTTVTYEDDSTVIATAMPEVSPGIMVTVTLTGLTGSVTFAE